MLEATAINVVLLFVIHVVILLAVNLGKDHSSHQRIFLSGGSYAGEYQGAVYHQLLDDMNEMDDTVVQGKQIVTSSFSFIYIRLYQLYTGKCYDSYLENVLQIGRGSAASDAPALILDDPMVSKKHCMLYRRGDQIMIQDLESLNHTYVNGCRIEGAVPINHGDQLSLGKSKYQFQCYYQG